MSELKSGYKCTQIAVKTKTYPILASVKIQKIVILKPSILYDLDRQPTLSSKL